MIDALGAPQSVLVLGAGSDIAGATLDAFVDAGRLRTVVLAARRPDALAERVTRLRSAGVAEVRAVALVAADAAQVAGVVDAAFDADEIDVVLLAFGTLPDQQQALVDDAVAADTAQVNYVGAAGACLAAGRRLRAQGHGVLVVLSSVAAQRPRRANFVYGAAKAGLDALARGLADELHGSGASVLLVRPGFVHSAMTRGLDPAPFATTPDVVARAIAANLTRGSRTIWVPGVLRPVMAVLTALPQAVFRRLPA